MIVNMIFSALDMELSYCIEGVLAVTWTWLSVLSKSGST